MLYHIICDLIPFNVIVWYNSYFDMLYHIFHNVIPLCLTVWVYETMIGPAPINNSDHVIIDYQT